jgi:hypothetical protein
VVLGGDLGGGKMEIVINHFEGGMPQDFFQAEDITTVKKIIRGEGVAAKVHLAPPRPGDVQETAQDTGN